MSEPIGDDAYGGGGVAKRYSGFKYDQMQQKSKSESSGRAHLLAPSSYGSVSKGVRRKS